MITPAAIGLMAASANSAELNINTVSEYSAFDQQTSVSQFSDVNPSDWAYQALVSLVESYGCVAGYPTATFNGNHVITRYEAAALLNTCLDSVTVITDDLKTLLNEFEPELAFIKGQVDGLEAGIGELQSIQFSTTTKLKGYTTWVAGGAQGFKNDKSEAFTLNYDLHLALNTSFKGTDMLIAEMRSGNFGDTVWYDGLASLETSFESNNTLVIDKLYYTFPIGDNLTVAAGPRVYSDDDGMKAGDAMFYPYDQFLNFFSYGGTWATNNAETPGAGIGAVFDFEDSGFSLSGNYIAMDGESAGIGNSKTSSTSSWQLFYEGEALDGLLLAQLGFSYEQNIFLPVATNSAYKFEGQSRFGYSAAAAWMPNDPGIIPSISTGFSFSDPQGNDKKIKGWYVGLEWNDFLIEENSVGIAVGQAPNTQNDYNKIYEVFYEIYVSDNIAISPAYFIIDNYSGDNLSGDFVHGGAVKTTFKF